MAKVIIEFDAVDNVSDVEKQILSSTKKMGDGFEDVNKRSATTSTTLKQSWTEFRSAYSTVLDVVRVGQQVWAGTVDQIVEYGDQVQKLKTITGQSAEAVSNQIQLADDARVSYEKLTIALQTASKKGIDTSLDGLAKLADEYKALPAGIERTQFLTEKFGKSGVDMGKILEMDTQAIKKFKANAGQILTDADLAKIKEYNHSLDGMKDKFESTKGSIGKGLMPIGTGALDSMSLYLRTIELMSSEHLSLKDAANQARDEINADKAAFLATDDAAGALEDGLGDLGDAEKTAEEQAQRMSTAYQGLLASMFDIQKSDEDHIKNLDDLAQKEVDNTNKRNDALHDYLETKNKIAQSDDTGAQKLQASTEATIEYQQKIKELDDDLAGIGKTREELSQKETEAANKRIYDLEQSRLAGDGIINSDEYKFLQDEAVNLGLVSRAAADLAISDSNAADQRVAGFMKVQDPMLTDLQIMQQLAQYSGTVVDFGINYHSNTPPSMSGGGAPQYHPPTIHGPIPHHRDSGGSGMAGGAYMIGVGAQPEGFVPSTNGTFIPNIDKKLGSSTTINVVINNPKGETTENSINKTLMRLSETGVLK